RRAPVDRRALRDRARGARGRPRARRELRVLRALGAARRPAAAPLPRQRAGRRGRRLRAAPAVSDGTRRRAARRGERRAARGVRGRRARGAHRDRAELCAAGQATSLAVSPDAPELSIVMPCLDEAETLGTCIEKARRFLATSGVSGEIIVADNGSSDGSQDIAQRLGARVVEVPERGYGSALHGGISAARGRYVIFGDSDDSYDFSDLGAFLARLRKGDALVMGNRFRGGIRPGAMPPLHRFFGNPLLSAIGRLFFGAPVGDFHCGLRAVSRAAYEQMAPTTSGMEYASELVIKATLAGLPISEV